MRPLGNLLREPLFLLGLALRIGLLAGMAPAPVLTWYAPFLAFGMEARPWDPWSAWLAAGGDALAFPYGYAMWIAFLPGAAIAAVTRLPVGLAHGWTLLAADFLLLRLLDALAPRRQRLLLALYWLSPVVLLATYVLGYNDIVPAALLVLAVSGLRSMRLRLAGAALAAAISAKLSMVVALPFFAMYLVSRRALRVRSNGFTLALTAVTLLLGVPFLLSAGAVQMLAGNPELAKVYELAIGFGDHSVVYVVPLAYLLILYFTWRIRRLNFQIFQASLGAAFLSLVLLTPAAPGWLVWCLPFLYLYQASNGRAAIAAVACFSALYVVHTLLMLPLNTVHHGTLNLAGALRQAGLPVPGTSSLEHTAMAATGIVLGVRMWRETVGRNDYFRLSRRPFVLGIAGDSGAGKDTFADALTALFGAHSVARLSGDDYHLWDRHKPMWQAMTHLNPMANDLEGFSRDLLYLVDGRPVQVRHYDHATGKTGKPVRTRSNDIIIASGLHVLYLPLLRERCDLKIFLDIDEGLRRHFKLRRDVGQRGHPVARVLAALQSREPDAVRFIRPQATHADLVFRLQSARRDLLLEGADGTATPRLSLVVRTRQGYSERSLHRVLVGLCGLHVDLHLSEDGRDMDMAIEGDCSAADVRLAADLLYPRMQEFLDLPAGWQDGMLGIMQLVTLSHVSHALTKRLL